MITLKRPVFIDQKYSYTKMPGGVISQFFGENGTPFYKSIGLAGHNGIDFACVNGTKIFAAHDGEVSKTWTDANSTATKGFGVQLWGHDGTYYTIYWHFQSVSVKAGDKVKAGDLLGYSNNTGQSSGPHLHFALYLNPLDMTNGYDGAVDPMPYFEEIIKINDMYNLYFAPNSKEVWAVKPGIVRRHIANSQTLVLGSKDPDKLWFWQAGSVIPAYPGTEASFLAIIAGAEIHLDPIE